MLRSVPQHRRDPRRRDNLLVDPCHPPPLLLVRTLMILYPNLVPQPAAPVQRLQVLLDRYYIRVLLAPYRVLIAPSYRRRCLLGRFLRR